MLADREVIFISRLVLAGPDREVIFISRLYRLVDREVILISWSEQAG